MNRRILGRWATATLTLALLASTPWALAQAQEEAPDVLIKRVSSDVLESIKSDKAVQAGETSRVISLVDSKIIPHVNFVRMTASAVGRNWRQATPEQQKRLQEEFKILLIRTYSGALAQVKDQSVNVKPLRAAAGEAEVVVAQRVAGPGCPVPAGLPHGRNRHWLEDL